MMLHNEYHLVLSGGGIRGFAHVGVYKALCELGYVVTSVAGTSMGALIGALIASGKTPFEIEQLCVQKSLLEYINLTFGNEGILSAEKIRNTLQKATDVKNIEELTLPFAVCVTDVAGAKALYYSQGDLATLVSASCAVPGIFEPIVYDDKYLIDGGVTDNLPISTKPEGSRMIGVHVNPIVSQKTYNAKEISMLSLKILINRDIVVQGAACDIFIEPPALADISQSLFVDTKKVIDVGYAYVMHMLGDKK